jgi:arginase
MGRGPSRLFETGIVEALERSGGNVRVTEALLADDTFTSEISSAFALQSIVADRVAKSKRDGALPIVLSGNCNTAVGTVAGLTSASGSVPSVCWLDAHADMNTPETTTSGFLDGMAVAMLAGRCWTSMTSTIPGFAPVDESRIVMMGVRDVDTRERRNLQGSDVRVIPAEFTDADLDFLAPSDRSLYLHVDLDVFDVSEGVANSYAIAGGMTRDSFMRLAKAVRSNARLGAVALTAYDPAFDMDNRIARLAIDIAVALATGSGLS